MSGRVVKHGPDREVDNGITSSLINARIPCNDRGSWSSMHPVTPTVTICGPWSLFQEFKSHSSSVISSVRSDLVTPQPYMCVSVCAFISVYSKTTPYYVVHCSPQIESLTVFVISEFLTSGPVTCTINTRVVVPNPCTEHFSIELEVLLVGTVGWILRGISLCTII